MSSSSFPSNLSSSSSSSSSSGVLIGSKVFHSAEVWMQQQMLSPEEVSSGAIEAQGTGMIVNQVNNLERLGYMETAPFAFVSFLSVEGEVWCGMVCVHGPVADSDTEAPAPFTAFPSEAAGLLKIIRREGAASLLEISSTPLFPADPIFRAMSDAKQRNQSIYAGGVVLNYAQRRRLRINGRLVVNQDPQSNKVNQIELDQFFGNCPKYIPARSFQFRTVSEMNSSTKNIIEGLDWTNAHETIIKEADSFYLGSVYSGDGESRSKRHKTISAGAVAPSTIRSIGCDCSHRGGFPGFLSVSYLPSTTSALRTPLLIFGDYAGNRMYQSLGNVAGDGRVGMFIPNFASCSALYITGEASVVFDPLEAQNEFGLSRHQFPSSVNLAGAECLIVIRVKNSILAQNILPLKSKLLNYSPFNPGQPEQMKQNWGIRVPKQDEAVSAYQGSPKGHCKAGLCSAVENGKGTVEANSVSSSSAPTIRVDVAPPFGTAFPVSVFAMRSETPEIKSFLLISPWISLSDFQNAGYHECLPGDYAVFEFLIQQKNKINPKEMSVHKETRCWTLTLLPTVLYVRSAINSSAGMECRFALAITVKRQSPGSASKLSLSCYLHDELKVGSFMRLAAVQRTDGFSPFAGIRVTPEKLQLSQLANPAESAATEFSADLQRAISERVSALPSLHSLPSWLESTTASNAEGSSVTSIASAERQSALVASVFQQAVWLHKEMNQAIQLKLLPKEIPSNRLDEAQIAGMTVSHQLQPLIFLCSGIGITPFFTIIRHIIGFKSMRFSSSSSNSPSGPCGPILFVISVRHLSDLAFSDLLAFDSLKKCMEGSHPSTTLHLVLAISQGHETDINAKWKQSSTSGLSSAFRVGRLSEKVLAYEIDEWLQRFAKGQTTSSSSPSICHFYLCGSGSYQQTMHSAVNSELLTTTIRKTLGTATQILLHEEEFSY